MPLSVPDLFDAAYQNYPSVFLMQEPGYSSTRCHLHIDKNYHQVLHSDPYWQDQYISFLQILFCRFVQSFYRLANTCPAIRQATETSSCFSKICANVSEFAP